MTQRNKSSSSTLSAADNGSVINKLMDDFKHKREALLGRLQKKALLQKDGYFHNQLSQLCDSTLAGLADLVTEKADAKQALPCIVAVGG